MSRFLWFSVYVTMIRVGDDQVSDANQNVLYVLLVCFLTLNQTNFSEGRETSRQNYITGLVLDRTNKIRPSLP